MDVNTHERADVPNHTIDPETGFIESNGYLTAFDGEKKLLWLSRWKENGLSLYRTCRELGMSVSTVHTHYKIDPVFKAAYDDAEAEYLDRLESLSRTTALDPKCYVERIFQLKAFLPSKYGDSKSSSQQPVSIIVQGNLLIDAERRGKVLDAEIVKEAEGNVQSAA